MSKCTDLSALVPFVTSGPDDAYKFGCNLISYLVTLMLNKKFENYITGYITIRSTYL